MIKNDVIALAKELISCPSVTPQDANCQTILTARLAKLGFTTESLRFGEVDNLWARYGTESPLIVFAGHTDVVPPGPLNQWQSPPFSPDIRDGKLYGRGASDMKAAIAAMVCAVEDFLAKQKNFTGSIGFLLTSDEEGPAIDGTARVIKILQERNINLDYCIVGEPSSNQQLGDQIRVGRRGSLHGALTIHGKQGHVAYPNLAINLIHHGLRALHELAHTQWDQGNDYFPPTSFQISNIHSGTTGALNVIPGELQANFNFRFSTASTVEDLQQRTEAIFAQCTCPTKIDWHCSAKPFLSQQGKLVAITREVIRQLCGIEPVLSTGGGTSDARFIAPLGTEVIELGMINATAHHIDECVAVDDVVLLSQIYADILSKILATCEPWAQQRYT